MRRSIALIGIPLMLGTGLAQTRPAATSNSTTSDATGEALAERVYTQKDKGIKPPKAKYFRDADYPEKARASRKEGTVVLSLIVGSDGLPRDIKIARSVSPDLDQAATDAVKKWKFAPAIKDGQPVPCQITVQMLFKLY